MKAVILAGGLGTRLSEETEIKPKPMVQVGGRPILWHIMKTYSTFGIDEFIICVGYKGYIIKEYFANYLCHMSDITFDMRTDEIIVHQKYAEPWRVTVVDTGEETMTGGRLKRVKDYIGDDTFCFTYGDGVSNINISKLIEYHHSMGRQVTITAVQPPGRYGAIEIKDGLVDRFQEKPKGDDAWINGGYFVIEPEAIDLIESDEMSWEIEPLQTLSSKKQLAVYKHEGFWRPMDTLRDKNQLEKLWNTGEAPWKAW